MVQAQVEIHEHMQSKDVQAASETNVFTWTLLPFSADHSMDIKKNTFWGARTLVGPNGSQTTSEINAQMALMLKSH